MGYLPPAPPRRREIPQQRPEPFLSDPQDDSKVPLYVLGGIAFAVLGLIISLVAGLI